jgi:HD-like signal output (HDOD) protein
MTQNRSLVEMIEEQCSSNDLHLPVFPAAAIEIQRLIAQEDFSLTQISTVVCKDQALAGEVLRLANSAFFAGLRKIATIQDAVMRLGTKQVLSCIIMMGQKNLYRSNNSVINGYMQSLWKHASACALGTKWLLEKTAYKELAQEGFLAGLLHDIGKLLLLKIVEGARSSEDASLSEVFMLEVLESMHAQRGYEFLQRWNLPDAYCNVARNHHREDFDESDLLLVAVRLVNQASRKVGLGSHNDPALVLSSLPEAHALGINEIKLAELEVLIEDAASVA